MSFDAVDPEYECTLKGRLGRRRCHAFVAQQGVCFYCGQLMDFGPFVGGAQKPRACTVEHLDDRFDSWRGMKGDFRTVAACYECNHKKGMERGREMKPWKYGGVCEPVEPVENVMLISAENSSVTANQG